MTAVLQAKITGLAGPALLEAQGEAAPRLPGSPLVATALRALLLSPHCHPAATPGPTSSCKTFVSTCRATCLPPLPYKVHFAGSGDQDLDIFGSRSQPTTPTLLFY